MTNLLINSLTSVVAISVHLPKRSSVKRVLVLDLTFFIKLNSCSQRQELSDTSTKCFPISANFIVENKTVFKKVRLGGCGPRTETSLHTVNSKNSGRLAANTSETSVKMYQITQRKNSEDSHIQFDGVFTVHFHERSYA